MIQRPELQREGERTHQNLGRGGACTEEAHACCPLVAARFISLVTFPILGGPSLFNCKDLMMLRTYYVPGTALGLDPRTGFSIVLD